MNREPPSSNEARATISLVLLAVAAFVYFALPPAFVGAGPFSLGERTGECHGLKHEGEIVVEVCK